MIHMLKRSFDTGAFGAEKAEEVHPYANDEEIHTAREYLDILDERITNMENMQHFAGLFGSKNLAKFNKIKDTKYSPLYADIIHSDSASFGGSIVMLELLKEDRNKFCYRFVFLEDLHDAIGYVESEIEKTGNTEHKKDNESTEVELAYVRKFKKILEYADLVEKEIRKSMKELQTTHLHLSGDCNRKEYLFDPLEIGATKGE